MSAILSRVLFGLLALATVFAAGAAWLYWTDENNTLPIDRVLSAEQVANLPAGDKAEGPVIVCLGHNSFALINPTRFPIHYAGYTVHSIEPRPRRGEINPLYDKQFRDPAGKWQSNVGGWCGTGSALLTIPPGQAGQFNVHTGVDLPPERKGDFERVGVSYHMGDPGKTQTVWSEPIRQ